MCVGIPGKIIKITNPKTKLAMVDVSGVKREINIACIVDKEHSVNEIVAWQQRIDKNLLTMCVHCL